MTAVLRTTPGPDPSNGSRRPSWPLRAPIDTVFLSYFPDSSRWQITMSCPFELAEATCGTAVIAPTRNAADDVVSNAADPIRDARVLIV